MKRNSSKERLPRSPLSAPASPRAGRRAIAMTAALLLAAASGLYGCTGGKLSPAPAPSPAPDAETDTGTAAETETGRQKSVTGLPPETFGGYRFRFSNPSSDAQYWNHMALTAEEMNADTINDAIYERNATVEAQLDIRITESESGQGTAERDLKNSILSRADDYDAAYVRGNYIRDFYTSADDAFLYDFAKDVPNVDLSQPWWTQSANAGMSIGGKLPVVVGDISLSYFDSVMPIAMNLRLARDHGIEDPYTLVRTGKWTMDLVGEMMLLVADDLDGDGKCTLADAFGMYGMSEEYEALAVAAGAGILSKDENDMPRLSITDERFVAAFTKAVQILNGNNVFANYRLKQFMVEGGELSTFTDGRALFFSDVLFWISGLRNMEDDFAILPRAKYDEAQAQYYSFVHESAAWLCIPITADPARSGYILETLSAASHDTLIPTYYDVVLSQRFARDPDSVEMLDILFSTRVSDLGAIFNWCGVYDAIRNMGAKGDTGLVSYAKRIAPRIEKELARLTAAEADE